MGGLGPLTCERGCRQEVVLAGRATRWGGPSEVSAYECWIGCARAIGGRVGLDGETGEVFERRLSPGSPRGPAMGPVAAGAAAVT